jgi:Histidine kinase-, DNA gyrase B-, and HSP90-like ATPase
MSVTLVEAPVASTEQPVTPTLTTTSNNSATNSTATTTPAVTQYLRFEVKDTGPGVPDEKKCTLFKPFSQLQKGVGGTGLGLYSVKKKITVLGGSVGCENNPDTGDETGVIFWFTIPYTPDTWGNNPISAASSAYNSSMSLNRSQIDVMADEYIHVQQPAAAPAATQLEQEQQQQQHDVQQAHSSNSSSSSSTENCNEGRSGRCSGSNVYGVTVDTGAASAANVADSSEPTGNASTTVMNGNVNGNDIEAGHSRALNSSSSSNSGTGNHQQNRAASAWFSQQSRTLKSQSSLTTLTGSSSQQQQPAAAMYDSTSTGADDTECCRDNRAATEPGPCVESHSNRYSTHQLKVRQLHQQHLLRSAVPYALQRGVSTRRVVPDNAAVSSTTTATAATSTQQQLQQQQHGPITLAPLIHHGAQQNSSVNSSSGAATAVVVTSKGLKSDDTSKCVLIVEDEPSISKFLTVSLNTIQYNITYYLITLAYKVLGSVTLHMSRNTPAALLNRHMY